jgi:hypothetical protein
VKQGFYFYSLVSDDFVEFVSEGLHRVVSRYIPLGAMDTPLSEGLPAQFINFLLKK